MGDKPDFGWRSPALCFPASVSLPADPAALAEFDHIAIAILPVVQEGEIVNDLLKRRHHAGQLSTCLDIGETVDDLNP